MEEEHKPVEHGRTLRAGKCSGRLADEMVDEKPQVHKWRPEDVYGDLN